MKASILLYIKGAPKKCVCASNQNGLSGDSPPGVTPWEVQFQDIIIEHKGTTMKSVQVIVDTILLLYMKSTTLS